MYIAGREDLAAGLPGALIPLRRLCPSGGWWPRLRKQGASPSPVLQLDHQHSSLASSWGLQLHKGRSRREPPKGASLFLGLLCLEQDPPLHCELKADRHGDSPMPQVLNHFHAQGLIRSADRETCFTDEETEACRHVTWVRWRSLPCVWQDSKEGAPEPRS